MNTICTIDSETISLESCLCTEHRVRGRMINVRVCKIMLRCAHLLECGVWRVGLEMYHLFVVQSDATETQPLSTLTSILHNFNMQCHSHFASQTTSIVTREAQSLI